MHVTLDQEHWEVADARTLGDVLADISEKSHARSRLITSLTVDQRPITDRDLDPDFLKVSIARFSQLTAISQTIDDVMHGAAQSIQQYATLLQSDARELATEFRMGEERLTSLDAWLGKLADYIELVESGRRTTPSGKSLTPWVHELLEARSERDVVRLADLLEYELIPRLEY
jgi:uncharacterized ferritin-like protein (DUF455 family)